MRTPKAKSATVQADLLISGGKAVLPGHKAGLADILVRNGRISKILPHGKANNAKALRVLDARGKLVLPGVIDPHVHFLLPMGTVTTADDFLSGSKAAIAGGTTTVINYTTQGPGVPLEQALEERLSLARNNHYCDFGLHAIIPSWKKLNNPQEQIKRLMELGVPSFKMFMIYAERGLQADDADIFRALEVSRETGALVCLHAESDAVMNLLVARYRNKGLGAYAHALSRPDYTEWEAVQRALVWAEATKGHVYFVHQSAGRSAQLIAAARKRGIRVTGETCPQYLTLDDSIFKKPQGHIYASCPQVKKKRDSLLLWQELRDGGISIIGTDHCAFTKRQKDGWGGDITKIPFGLPGVETALPLLYTEGVLRGRITLERLVEVMCENPAKVHGLYPRKGALRQGADADIVIIDPKATRKVEYSSMQTACDWNPYEGRKLAGFPETVLLRGETVVENGTLSGKKPAGIFLKRGKPQII